MGQVMTLLEVTSALDQFDSAATIYCKKPWARDSIAVVALEPESGQLPEEVQKLELSYFLEIDVAKDMLEGWMKNIEGHPSLEVQCDRVIQYAVNDA
jgi:hypothetical protein